MFSLAFAEEMVNVVPAVVEPNSVPDALGVVPVLVEAYRNGNYLLAGALISLVLTFVIRAFVLPKLKLGHGVLPLLSALIGMISGVGLAIANGAPLEAAAMAILSGPLASSFWDSLLKYGFKK